MEHFLSIISIPKEAIKETVNKNKQTLTKKPQPNSLFLLSGRESIPCAVFYFFLFPSLASCFGLAERAN